MRHIEVSDVICDRLSRDYDPDTSKTSNLRLVRRPDRGDWLAIRLTAIPHRERYRVEQARAVH